MDAFYHITNTIHKDLHWLLVRQRILYKLCTPSVLRHAAPSYLRSVVYSCISDNGSFVSYVSAHVVI